MAKFVDKFYFTKTAAIEAAKERGYTEFLADYSTETKVYYDKPNSGERAYIYTAIGRWYVYEYIAKKGE